MEAPPVIKSDSLRRLTEKDALFRSGVAVVVGVLFFWLPIWYGRSLGNVDSRVGFIIAPMLPFIALFARYATRAIVAISPASSLRSCIRSPLHGVALLLCWAPRVYFGYSLLVLCAAFAVALIKQL